ncbi:MAG: type II toxin-antitoxin system HicB family antitoxin [Thermoleophilaceae bacterium]
MSEYVVIYEEAPAGGWGAYLPDLPGVVALGKTREEVGARIEEALAAYVDEMERQGQTLPQPVHRAATLRV